MAKLITTMRYRYCAYWGTFDRVLQHYSATKNQMIEFSMTPINISYGDWDEVATIRIRKHCTSIDKKDEFMNVLPMHIWNLIGEKIGEERRDFMAYHTFDLENDIDWVKYAQLNNGGASYFDVIKKPETEEVF